jgi:hypothetical protein
VLLVGEGGDRGRSSYAIGWRAWIRARGPIWKVTTFVCSLRGSTWTRRSEWWRKKSRPFGRPFPTPAVPKKPPSFREGRLSAISE